MNNCYILFSAIVHLLAIALAWNVPKEHAEASFTRAFNADFVLYARPARAVSKTPSFASSPTSKNPMRKLIQKENLKAANTDQEKSGTSAALLGSLEQAPAALVRLRPFLQNAEQLKA